jgi:hypothetical protein
VLGFQEINILSLWYSMFFNDHFSLSYIFFAWILNLHIYIILLQLLLFLMSHTSSSPSSRFKLILKQMHTHTQLHWHHTIIATTDLLISVPNWKHHYVYQQENRQIAYFHMENYSVLRLELLKWHKYRTGHI